MFDLILTAFKISLSQTPTQIADVTYRPHIDSDHKWQRKAANPYIYELEPANFEK